MATRGKWWAALAQTGSAVRRHLLRTQMAGLGFPGLPGPWTGGLWPGCRGRSLRDVLCLDCHSHIRPFCSCPSQLGGGAGRPEGQEGLECRPSSLSFKLEYDHTSLYKFLQFYNFYSQIYQCFPFGVQVSPCLEKSFPFHPPRLWKHSLIFLLVHYGIII